MLRKATRDEWKYLLSLSRVKVLYSKITLTRYTTLYFLFAFFSCAVLVACQAFTYADNSQAAHLISEIVAEAGSPALMPIRKESGEIEICLTLPEYGGNCTTVEGEVSSLAAREIQYLITRGDDFEQFEVPRVRSTTKVLKREYDMHSVRNDTGDIIGVDVDDHFVNMQCVSALMWLQDVLQDATREDIVTLCFQIWLFILAIITILNESLPHLAAGLLAHLLGTVWAGSRIMVTTKMTDVYGDLVTIGPCRGVDILGGWWHERTMRTIPIMVLNAVVLLGMIAISYKLFQVYTRQSFNRVGSSPRIHNIYKLFLAFSVSLQLAGFFTFASTGTWMDKLLNGNVRHLTQHLEMYLAAFILVLLVQIPWLAFGWISARREGRTRFLVWIICSLVVLVIPALMFSSGVYRFVFSTWAFFATITITAYILICGTFVLGLFCRFHFGSGLLEYLQASEVPEGADFDPVVMGRSSMEKKSIDLESPPVSNLAPPKPAFHALPRREHTRPPSSIYSRPDLGTIKVSITPEFLRPLSAAARRSMSRVTRLRVSLAATTDSRTSSNRDSYIGTLHAPSPTQPVSTAPQHPPGNNAIGNNKMVGITKNPRPQA